MPSSLDPGAIFSSNQPDSRALMPRREAMLIPFEYSLQIYSIYNISVTNTLYELSLIKFSASASSLVIRLWL